MTHPITHETLVLLALRLVGEEVIILLQAVVETEAATRSQVPPVKVHEFFDRVVCLKDLVKRVKNDVVLVIIIVTVTPATPARARSMPVIVHVLAATLFRFLQHRQ
jgi:hypothetical protein